MNYRRFSYVFFMFIIIGVIAMVTYTSSLLLKNEDNYTYVLRNIVENDLPVINEVQTIKETINAPYNGTNVEIEVNYYNINDDKETQERSLILYEDTYIPNTGILYKSLESFEIISIFNGKVSNITTDEIFGNTIEITYNNNMVARYSSVDNITVSIGDSVSTGEVIATSGVNKVSTSSKYMLLFELIINGKNVDPEEYYNKTIDEMSI